MKLRNIVFAAAFAVVASYPTFANDRLIEGRFIAEACARDVLHLCGGVQPADGSISACVREKIAQLTSCRWMVRPSR
jgi:hypothetical protein